MPDTLTLALGVFGGLALHQAAEALLEWRRQYWRAKVAEAFRKRALAELVDNPEFVERTDVDAMASAVLWQADRMADVVGGTRNDHYEGALMYVTAQVEAGLTIHDHIMSGAAGDGDETGVTPGQYL